MRAAKNQETSEQETVTIPKSEYSKLKSSEVKLEFLEAHGVDNWNGYEDAIEEFHNWEEKNWDE